MITNTFDTTNRLTAASGQSYTWSANGNLLNTGSLTNTFDTANRLIQSQRSITTLQVSYNGLNDRVAQTVGVTTTSFALDSALALPEVISTSQGTAYLHLPGVIMAQNASGQRVYLLSDGLGSIRQVISATTIVSQRDFDPYGNPTGATAFSDPYGFTGEWWEQDVKLLHLRARWYDVQNGIFLSKDPWSGDEQRPQSLNGWNYVQGNPVNLTDPSGNQVAEGILSTTCVLALPACGAAVTAAAVTIGVVVIIAGPFVVIEAYGDFAAQHPELVWRPKYGPGPVPEPAAPPMAPPLIGTPPASCYFSADGCRPISAIPDPQPGGTPEPEPNPTPPGIDIYIPTCTPDNSDKFYYARRGFNQRYYKSSGYTALRYQLISSSVPGTGTGLFTPDGLAGQLQGRWRYYQRNIADDFAKNSYAGYAFQAQRVLYYARHNLAVATTGSRGTPDITVNWNTGGQPTKIEGIEVKFNDSGANPIGLAQISEYRAKFGQNWLLEVSRLTPSVQAYLQSLGGVRFNENLYPK